MNNEKYRNDYISECSTRYNKYLLGNCLKVKLKSRMFVKVCPLNF